MLGYATVGTNGIETARGSGEATPGDLRAFRMGGAA